MGEIYEHDENAMGRMQKAAQAAKDMLRDAGFDAVTILGAWQSEQDLTCTIIEGFGSIHARHGLASYFLTRQNFRIEAEVADEYGPEGDEDGD